MHSIISPYRNTPLPIITIILIYHTILVSAGIIDFKTISTPFENDLSHVRFLNNQFVAWGPNGFIASSKDGTLWNTHQLTDVSSPFTLDYGNSTYVAVTEYGNIWTSSDLDQWKHVFSPAQYDFRSNMNMSEVKFIEHLGVFQTKSRRYGIHLESADTNHWGAIRDKLGLRENNVFDIEVSDGKIFIVNERQVDSSYDGRKWTVERTYPASTVGVMLNEQVSLAVTLHAIHTSNDQLQWQETNNFNYGILQGMAQGKGVFLVILKDAVNDDHYITESWDGYEWFGYRSPHSPGSPTSVCFANGIFIIVGQNGLIQQSTDFLYPKLEITNHLTTRKFYRGQQALLNFLVAGKPPLSYEWKHNDQLLSELGPKLLIQSIEPENAGTYTFKATDGDGQSLVEEVQITVDPTPPWRVWTKARELESDKLLGTQWINDRFWAVGENGTLRVSDDGTVWETISMEHDLTFNDIALLDGKMLIMGNEGTLLSSEEGTQWEELPYPANVDLLSFHPGGPNPIIVGKQGHISLYENGEWVVINSGTTEQLNDVDYFETGYLAVGNNGTIISSTEGRTWNSYNLQDRVHLNEIGNGIRGAVILGGSDTEITIWKADPSPQEWANKQTLQTFRDSVWNAVAVYPGGFVFSGDLISSYISSGGREDHSNLLAATTNDMAVNQSRVGVAVGDLGSILTDQPGPGGWISINDQTHQLSVTHGNGTYMSGSGLRGLTSKNGNDWNPISFPQATQFGFLDYLPPYFLMVNDRGPIYKSIDAKSWEEVEKPINTDWRDAVVFDKKLVLLSDSGSMYVTSNFQDWDKIAIAVPEHSFPTFSVARDSIFLHGQSNLLMISHNAYDWEDFSQPTQDDVTYDHVFRLNDKLFVYSSRRERVFISENDGESWQESPLKLDDSINTFPFVRYHGTRNIHGHLFTTGYESSQILHSSDGISWEPIKIEPGIMIYDFIPYQNKAMAVGTLGRIYMSGPLKNTPNLQPGFTPGPNIGIVEDSGDQHIIHWATDLSAGLNEELVQSIHFITETDTPNLFTQTPAVLSDGSMRFTSAPNAFGTANVSVFLKDNGGTPNGGSDQSLTKTFQIQINPSNDPPSFDPGENITIPADGGPQTIVPWAKNIRSGPENEMDQSVAFAVKTDQPDWFNDPPTIAPNGNLSFTPSIKATGMANVTVVLEDSGGTENGGINTSEAQTFSIHITPGETPPEPQPTPSFIAGPDISVHEDSGDHSIQNWATHIDSGIEATEGFNLRFDVDMDNPLLFLNQPTINNEGHLNFTLTKNGFGSTKGQVVLNRSSDADLEGIHSAPQSFNISILNVNDSPSFNLPDELSIPGIDETQSLPNWITEISAGPSNESDQSLTFNVATDRPELFSVTPEVTPAGTLTFTPAPNAKGTAGLFISLKDDGGTSRGGVDVSATKRSKIILTDPEGEISVSKITMAEEGIVLSWSTVTGSRYKILYKNSLHESNWSTFLTTITGNGSKISFTDTTPIERNRFYQILKIGN